MLYDPTLPSAAKITHRVFLKDQQGLVQLVLAGNQLVDLAQLAKLSARHFEKLPEAELKQLRQRYGSLDFPAISRAKSLELWLGQNITEQDFLYQWSDTGWQRIERGALHHAAQAAVIKPFGIELPELSFDSHQDLQAVNGAIHAFTRLRIQQRLSETLDLPPLPEIANRIINLRTDSNAGPKELAQVVELDPSLTAQVVNWARSPFYGQRAAIQSVEDAVVRVLGFDLVINLALGLSLGRNFALAKTGSQGYSAYWQQSILTAALCNELIRAMPTKLRPNTGMAYLCGLLHNFGFLILGQVFPPQFELVNRHLPLNTHINRAFIEQHLLGITREQISASLLEQWRMPEEVVIALRQQHNPNYTGSHAIFAHLLYIASRSLRQHNLGDGPAEPIADWLLDNLGLNAQRVTEITEQLLSRLHELQSLSQISGRPHA